MAKWGAHQKRKKTAGLSSHCWQWFCYCSSSRVLEALYPNVFLPFLIRGMLLGGIVVLHQERKQADRASSVKVRRQGALGVLAQQWMNKWRTLSGRCQVRHHSRWGGTWLCAIDAMIISIAIKQLVCLYMSPLIGCSPLLLLVLSVCQCWELQIAKTHCKQCDFQSLCHGISKCGQIV